MEKVVAVTVTYNDVEYLLKAVDYLQRQSYSLEKVIVVDNCSNDKCKNILKDNINNDFVDVLWLDENLGGAGGFEKGMEYAVEKYNADWYWLMDADAYPEENCLENLFKYKDHSSNVGYLAPLILGADLKAFQLYHHKRLSNYLEKDLHIYKNESEIQPIIDIEADAFVGPLISKKAVKEVGIPEGDLFIYGDDLEYTYRITRKFDAFLIKDAVINHRDQPFNNGSQKPGNWWKDYYMYRNRILFIREFQNNSLKRLIGLFLVKLRCLKQIILVHKSGLDKKLVKLRISIIKRAYKDGIENKKGRTLDPNDYKECVKKLMNQ